jgi:calcineurin-like phosphoesterase
MRRFVTGMGKERFTPALGEATLSGLYVETEDRTGRATRAVPVRIGGRCPRRGPEPMTAPTTTLRGAR